MTYKISVIVPIYNQEKYLEKAIESVINQTIGFQNIELILVDDCSTDNSQNIIKKYAEKYCNIYAIFLEKNSGNAATPRNKGIKKSSAKYIMFLDPDDEFISDFCEKMYKEIHETDVDLVKCNFILIQNNENIFKYYFDESIDKKIIKNTEKPLKYVSIWNGIHKSDIIKENNIIFPNGTGEDIYFTTYEFLNISKMAYLNNYFGYKYYDRNDSKAKTPTKEKIQSIIEVFKLTKNICIKSKREDVMNIILGQQYPGLLMRITNTNSTYKIELLKETYALRSSMPNIIIPSLVYKFADFLIMKRLFYLTVLYLKIAPKIYSSKILSKLKKLF